MLTTPFPGWLLLPVHHNFMGKIGAEEESEGKNLPSFYVLFLTILDCWA